MKPMEVFNALHKAQQMSEAMWSEKFGTDGLTLRQAAVLDAVGEAPGCNQTYITNRTAIDRSTMSDVVRRLEQAGMIKRKRSVADSRAFEVAITAAGKKALEAVMKIAPSVERKLLGSPAFAELRVICGSR
jgi:DNA-binding MarR family transcriptional regulator